MAHIHRSNAIIWSDEPDYATAERRRAFRLIKAAADQMESHPRGIAPDIKATVRVQLAFQELRIAAEAGEQTMAEEALKRMRDFAGDDARTRLDLLRGEISVCLLGGKDKWVIAEDKLGEAWQVYQGLGERSPYTYFSLMYREAKLWQLAKKQNAQKETAAKYFMRYNKYPNLFTYGRMRDLYRGRVPVPVVDPEIYAVRTSAFYCEDRFVRL